jgi:predicted acylesterase/phospholipase RssA
MRTPALLLSLLVVAPVPFVLAQQPVDSATKTPPKRALVVSGGGAKGAYAAGVLSVLMRDSAALKPPSKGDSLAERDTLAKRDTLVKRDTPAKRGSPAKRGAPAKGDTLTKQCVAPARGSLEFDVLVGTSTGALITPLAHQRRVREMTRFYTTYGTADVLTQRPIFEALTNAESFYKVSQLRRLLLEEYAATGLWDGIRDDPNRLLVVTGVDLQRSDLVLFYVGKPSNWDVAEVGVRWQPIADEREFLEAILASSSEPVGMPPVRWKNSLIWDGGVRSAIPLSVALAQKGVEEVWVIGLNPSPDSPMRWDTKPPATGLEVLGRTIEVFSNNVAANDIAKMNLLVKAWGERAHTFELQTFIKNVLSVEELSDDLRDEAEQQDTLLMVETTKDTVLGALEDDPRSSVQVFVIRPSENLPGSSLNNTLQDQRRMYLHGQKDAKEFLTWLQGECTRLKDDEKEDPRSVNFRVFSQTAR